MQAGPSGALASSGLGHVAGLRLKIVAGSIAMATPPVSTSRGANHVPSYREHRDMQRPDEANPKTDNLCHGWFTINTREN
jgi:hypothetical protein